MADERTHGVILRTRPLTETSLLVNWLTADWGRMTTVAKGARRPKSAFRGKLDLFHEAEFSFARSRRSDLHTLREVSLLRTHSNLRKDLDRLEQAAYFGAFIEQTTETETPIPEFHALLREALQEIQEQPLSVLPIVAFELKGLEILGLNPDWKQTRLTDETKHLATTLQNGDWSELVHLPRIPAREKELRQFLNGFLVQHLDRVPYGRARALEFDDSALGSPKEPG